MDVIHELILRLTPLIVEYGALSVFAISVIEEIIVPIPSSFILLAAGFFLLPFGGSFVDLLPDLFYRVVIPGGIGLALGSMFVYALAYLGGEPAVRRWGGWLGITWEDVEAFKKRFRKSYWDEVTIFSLRSIPIVPHVIISAACGGIKYPPQNFFILSALGSMVRAFTMGLIGWYLGEAYLEYSDSLSNITSWALLGIGLMTIIVFVWWLIRKRKTKTA